MLPNTLATQAEACTNPDFERLFREHGALVYRTAYAIMGNREDADDILQTVFLRLLRLECPPTLASNPEGYFYRAAVNASLDTLKIRRRQPRRTDDPDQVAAPPSISVTFDEDMHRRLYAAIAQLRRDSAEMLVLRYVHNVSDAKIAVMLGVSRTVVAVRLFRARARLKALIRTSLGEIS
jgi:RNA polymerase sigma-70 factor (ECF subfamily)